METKESFRGGVFGGEVGLARIGRANAVLVLGVITLFHVLTGTALGDHVCGGGIPDCAACCIPGGCLEVSRTDCVLIHDGNPQEPGSDCHDFNFDGTADACEPDFPMCLPSADELFCDGACPGPLPCNASKVRVNLATFEYEVLECACRSCRVCLECDAFPPPCMGDCPAGYLCTRTEVCHTKEICDIECDCQLVPEPQACCIFNAAITCQPRLPADCLAIGGIPQGQASVCEGHEACCLPDGSCTFVDRICCDDLGGTSHGPGSQCLGSGACCYDTNQDFVPDACIEADELCCDALSGNFHGLGTTCSDNVGACCFGFVFGMCTDNLNETCCEALEAGLFVGDGTVCLGDGNGNGFDDACEEALCGPNPGGNACSQTQCPNNQEMCVPTKVRCTPSGAVCEIIECDCQNPNRCHIDLPPGGKSL